MQEWEISLWRSIEVLGKVYVSAPTREEAIKQAREFAKNNDCNWQENAVHDEGVDHVYLIGS